MRAAENNLESFGPMSPIEQATLKELEAMAISPRPDDTWRQHGNAPVFLHSRSASPPADPTPNFNSGQATSAFAAPDTPPSQAGQPPPRNLGAYPQFHSTRNGFGGVEGFGLSRDARAGTWNGQLTIELPFDSLMPGLLSPVAGDLHSCLLSPTTGLLANLLSPSDFMNSSPAGEPPAALLNRTSGSPLSFPPVGNSEGVSLSPGVRVSRYDNQTTASLMSGGTMAVPPPAPEPAMVPTAVTGVPNTERQSTSGNCTPFNASHASNSGMPVAVPSNHGISEASGNASSQSGADGLERRVSSVILEMALNGIFTNGQPGDDQQAGDSTPVSDQATRVQTQQRQLPSVDVQPAPAVDEHMIQMIMGHLGQLGQPLPPLEQQQQQQQQPQQLGRSSQQGHSMRMPSLVVDLAPLDSQLGAGPMPITPGMMPFNWCPPSPLPAYNKTEYQLNKRPRPGKLELTFEAYEKRYKLPAARCSSGTCADHCNMPCELHTCKCCKKHRYLDIEGVAKNRRYCGFCLRREKVDGLEFVKCCHVAMVDGVSQQCNAQMLKDAFEYHWNQHKSDLPPAFQTVDTDEGRKCGTCTNMRPVTYYSRSDTNCSCSHCQSSRTTGRKGPSKAGTSSGRAKRLSVPGLSTPGLSGLTGTTLGASGDVDGTGDSVWRRKSYTDVSDLSNMKANMPGTPSYVEQLTGGTDPATPSYSTLVEGGGSMNNPFAHTQMMPVEPFTPPQFPTFGMGAAYDSNHSSRQNTAQKLSPFPSYNGGGFTTNSPSKSLPADLVDGPTLIQQAQSLASTSLGGAVSSAPSFRVLLGKWNESRFQSGSAQTALFNMIRATRELEREAQLVVGAASETEVKELLAQGNGLMNNPQ